MINTANINNYLNNLFQIQQDLSTSAEKITWNNKTVTSSLSSFFKVSSQFSNISQNVIQFFSEKKGSIVQNSISHISGASRKVVQFFSGKKGKLARVSLIAALVSLPIIFFPGGGIPIDKNTPFLPFPAYRNDSISLLDLLAKNSLSLLNSTIPLNFSTDHSSKFDFKPPEIDSSFSKAENFTNSAFNASVAINLPPKAPSAYKSIEPLLSSLSSISLSWILKDSTLGPLFDLSRSKNFIALQPVIYASEISDFKNPSSILKFFGKTAVLLNEIYLSYDFLQSCGMSQSALLVKRLVSDTFYLGAQAFHYAKAIQTSGRYFAAQQYSPRLGILHSFSFFAGLQGLFSTFIQGNNLYQGAQVFSTLDEAQQKGFLERRAIHMIAKQKPCNAVIIDGLSSQWGTMLDGTPFPMGELFYENCNTQSYHVTSDEEFCDALKGAEEHFGAPIDTLSLEGHANGEMMTLNKNYYFSGNEKTLNCLDQTMKSDGQIFLLGCNTATRELAPYRYSLTERIAHFLPTREINGVRANFNPFISYQTFSNGTFSIKSFYPIDSNNEFFLGNTVRTWNGAMVKEQIEKFTHEAASFYKKEKMDYDECVERVSQILNLTGSAIGNQSLKRATEACLRIFSIEDLTTDSKEFLK